VRAESTLRRASAQAGADTRVRQNLALVVGLQGRIAEAETIARVDLRLEGSAANVTYLQKMLAQQNGWTQQGEPDKQVHAHGS
jgi:Flp pilus assembly protein TadD